MVRLRAQEGMSLENSMLVQELSMRQGQVRGEKVYGFVHSWWPESNRTMNAVLFSCLGPAPDFTKGDSYYQTAIIQLLEPKITGNRQICSVFNLGIASL